MGELEFYGENGKIDYIYCKNCGFGWLEFYSACGNVILRNNNEFLFWIPDIFIPYT